MNTADITTVQVASLFIGVFIPILVALVTKSTAQPVLKAVVHLLLAAVSGFLVEYVEDPNFVFAQALLTALMTWVVGVASYLGLLRHTPLAGADSPVGRALTG